MMLVRCAQCGERLEAGDVVIQGPDGELYCDHTCFAAATAQEVVIEDEGVLPCGGLDYAYVDAVQQAVAGQELAREADQLVQLWRGVAQQLREDGKASMAVCFEQCAEALESLLETASPAVSGMLADLAGDALVAVGGRD